MCEEDKTRKAGRLNKERRGRTAAEPACARARTALSAASRSARSLRGRREKERVSSERRRPKARTTWLSRGSCAALSLQSRRFQGARTHDPQHSQSYQRNCGAVHTLFNANHIFDGQSLSLIPHGPWPPRNHSKYSSSRNAKFKRTPFRRRRVVRELHYMIVNSDYVVQV